MVAGCEVLVTRWCGHESRVETDWQIRRLEDLLSICNSPMVIRETENTILAGIINQAAKQAATVAGIHPGYVGKVIHF